MSHPPCPARSRCLRCGVSVQVPRSLRDACLAGLSRAAFRAAAVLMIGALSGVAWGSLPEEPRPARTFEMSPVEVVVERGPAIRPSL
jgi:ribosomal protein S14